MKFILDDSACCELNQGAISLLATNDFGELIILPFALPFSAGLMEGRTAVEANLDPYRQKARSDLNSAILPFKLPHTLDAQLQTSYGEV